MVRVIFGQSFTIDRMEPQQQPKCIRQGRAGRRMSIEQLLRHRHVHSEFLFARCLFPSAILPLVDNLQWYFQWEGQVG